MYTGTCKHVVSRIECLHREGCVSLSPELVKPVFDRAGLSAPHSGEWFIGRPRLHGDTKTRSGPLFFVCVFCVCFFFFIPVPQ